MIVSVYGLGPDNIIMGLGKTQRGGHSKSALLKNRRIVWVRDSVT
jgi:hypothetical protein